MSYFKSEEFECPCCNKVIISAFLIHLLNKIREGLGKPMIVSSGYRCKKHNKKIGGADNSAHLRGTASDIACDNSRDRYKIIYLAYQAGFNRIGIHEKFIHLDIDEKLPRSVLFLY
jgi:zinc D-Ala-D-Ala carboxypeptidase